MDKMRERFIWQRARHGQMHRGMSQGGGLVVQEQVWHCSIEKCRWQRAGEEATETE
jgi:hypothetical protein